MFENIDIVTVIAGIIAVIGFIGTIVESMVAKKYLGVIQAMLDLASEFFKGNSDGVFTDEEYNIIGKKFVAVAKKINNDETVPAEISKEV